VEAEGRRILVAIEEFFGLREERAPQA
jgi:hypothetical protein